MLHARFELADGALLVTPFTTRLDAAVAPEFRALVAEHARGVRVVVVCLANVASVDASGLAALVAVLKALPPGGAVRLAGVRAELRALLEATYLDELLPEYGDATAALRP